MKRKLLVLGLLFTTLMGFSQSAILSIDTPPSAASGTTITVGFNYTASSAGTCQIQLFKTDANGDIDYSTGTNLYFSDAIVASATSTTKSNTFTIPEDFALSNSFPVGVFYKWFIKITVGGADYYGENPILDVVSSNLNSKSFNTNSVKVLYNSKSKTLVFFNIEESEMTLYDSKGSKKNIFNDLHQNESVDVSTFSPGLYILKSKKGYAFKFVVN